MWEIPFLPINEITIAILVGAVLVGAGRELPAHPRVSALTVPNRSCRSCHGRNAKRRKAHALPRGLRAPAAPAPPFFGSPKKGGKEGSPLATTQGFCLRRYARPAPQPAHGRRGSRAHRPTPKSPPARRHPPGAKKTPHWPPCKKNALALELGVRD